MIDLHVARQIAARKYLEESKPYFDILTYIHSRCTGKLTAIMDLNGNITSIGRELPPDVKILDEEIRKEIRKIYDKHTRNLQ